MQTNLTEDAEFNSKAEIHPQWEWVADVRGKELKDLFNHKSDRPGLRPLDAAKQILVENAALREEGTLLWLSSPDCCEFSFRIESGVPILTDHWVKSARAQAEQ